MSNVYNVAVVVGSLRKASINRKVALALAELAKEAGIPDGVINIVTADAKNSVAIGKALCDSPLVRHLSFTGSTPVGRILMEQCAPTIKKVALELGGAVQKKMARLKKNLIETRYSK